MSLLKERENKNLQSEDLAERVEALKKIDLFATFPDNTLSRLVKHCKEITLSNEEVLFDEAATCKKMWVILSGQLLIYKLKKTINVLNPGDFLGEMSLIDGEPRSASARSVGDSILMEIDELVFQDVILDEPQAVKSVIGAVVTRARYNLEFIANEHLKLSCLVHDMRNYLVPLSISEVKMEGILKSMKGTQKDHKKREGWKGLNVGIKKMVGVKNNLLTLIDQTLGSTLRNKSQYIKTSGDIAELIRETSEEIICHKQLKGKSVTPQLPEKPLPNANFNRIDIKRVLQNFIINAGYASEKGGLIEVGVTANNGVIQVHVKDNGTGIPDDVKPLLLKEVYSSKTDGNGFGLLSCREIIEEYHQGKLWFESEWGKGTTFYFTLPA